MFEKEFAFLPESTRKLLMKYITTVASVYGANVDPFKLANTAIRDFLRTQASALCEAAGKRVIIYIAPDGIVQHYEYGSDDIEALEELLKEARDHAC